MKTSTKIISRTFVLGAAVSLAGACGSSESEENGGDGAFLTIVGDPNVYLESGAQADIEVRYHDGDDEPLHGEVEFSIQGDAAGAQLASSFATTDGGNAAVILEATNEEQASFTVQASAPDASPATWNVTLEEPAGPLDPNGSYQVDSNYNLVSGLEEGTVRTVVNTILTLTDDPVGALVDIAVEHCSEIFGSTVCSLAGSLLAGAIEDALEDALGEDAYAAFLAFGEGLNAIVHDFGVVSELTVEGAEGSRTADHVMTGVALSYGGEDRAFTMSDLGVDEVEVEGVVVAMTDDDSEISIDEHAMPFAYGAMLKIGIEQILAGLIVEGAEDLEALLVGIVPCEDVDAALSTMISDLLGFSVDLSGSCEILLGIAADQLMGLIEDIDSVGLELVVGGAAEPMSTNGDELVDMLIDGGWEGTLQYPAEVVANLAASDNTFEGERLE